MKPKKLTKSQRKTQFCYVIDLICKNTSPRLDYILDYLSDNLGVRLVQISTMHESNPDSVRLNYSNEALDNCISIYKSDFLFDTDKSTSQLSPDVQVDDCVQLFNAEKKRYHINFDLLSAIFFCLSRYEEYQPFQADVHGRFTGEASHAFKHGYLSMPVVDQWINLLKLKLSEQSTLKFKESADFKILPTIDVDSAWAFQNRSMAHAAGSLIKNAMTLKWNRVREQRSAQKFNLDPYDRFDYLKSKLESFDTIYFLLLHFQKPYDTAHYAKTQAFSELIKRIDAYSDIGMHPSYASYVDKDQLSKEQQQLSSILTRPITKSRQHFLKLSLPETYERLLDIGVEADYSMGYGDQIGFRAGTSKPFKWYNLALERVTALTIYPFCVMDVTLKDYLGLTPVEGIEEIRKMKHAIRNVGGQLSFIWHNSSFAEMDGWADWESVFESLLTS